VRVLQDESTAAFTLNERPFVLFTISSHNKVAFPAITSCARSKSMLTSPPPSRLITSPRRKTPYHFDPEIHFRLRIQGSKDLLVREPVSRSVTTEE